MGSEDILELAVALDSSGDLSSAHLSRLEEGTRPQSVGLFFEPRMHDRDGRGEVKMGGKVEGGAVFLGLGVLAELKDLEVVAGRGI